MHWKTQIRRAIILFLIALLSGASCMAANSLNWRTNQNLVTADIQYLKLSSLLEQIATVTKWQVFVEPDTSHDVSAKFKDLPPGQALRLLLGDLNFALLPETNSSPRLYVFRTSQRNATEQVRPAKPQSRGKVIPNELIVTLKPGVNIDELARSIGAKVKGRIAGSNAYRLQFDDEEATNSAREQLALNSDVASVENNYSIDRPPTPRELSTPGGVPPVHLQLNPPPANGRVVVGLIDTAVQSLGADLDRFLLKPVSVAGDALANADSPTHGTSMAETLLRSLETTTKGSTSVQILPVDVYGPNVSTSTFDLAKGIAAAINNGATVLNMSLGSEGDSSVLRDLIKDAIQKKIVIVAAAGNQPVTTPFYPAAYSDMGVIAVTATDPQGQLAPYANRGSFVTAAAPGTSIFSYGGQQWYAVGTSSSAALASGMVAGYMDTTHNGPDKVPAFINSTIGVKQAPGQ